ncbi:hypothetical protein LL045_08550 [Lactococcus lactis subsp. lactis]
MGTCYYFRSKAAVYQMDHDLDNWAIGSGLVGIFARQLLLWVVLII